MNRRLLHEWALLRSTLLKQKPELGQASSMGILKKFILKHKTKEAALKELIRLNGTTDTHTVFCEVCEVRMTEVEEQASKLVRQRDLCNSHCVMPTPTSS